MSNITMTLDDEVIKKVKKIAAEYLKRKKEKEISSLYRKAYGNGKYILGDDFACWEQEGVWPAD